jgi:hypothetical protein
MSTHCCRLRTAILGMTSSDLHNAQVGIALPQTLYSRPLFRVSNECSPEFSPPPMHNNWLQSR